MLFVGRGHFLSMQQTNLTRHPTSTPCTCPAALPPQFVSLVESVQANLARHPTSTPCTGPAALPPQFVSLVESVHLRFSAENDRCRRYHRCSRRRLWRRRLCSRRHLRHCATQDQNLYF